MSKTVKLKECPICGKRKYEGAIISFAGFYNTEIEKIICPDCELFGKRIKYFLKDFEGE